MRNVFALVATAGLALTLASPAQASTSSYELTLQDDYSGPQDGARSVGLECGPAGGEHPRADEACALIEAAGGSIADVRVQEEGFCPLIYRPVTVTAVGGGERYEETFGNDCLLKLAKGAIFDF